MMYGAKKFRSKSKDGATGKVEFDPTGDRKPSPDVGVLVQVQPNSEPRSDFRYKFALLQ